MNDPRETDLFGNPVRGRKGLRGRPRKEITEKDLDALEAGLVQGWANQRIANALDIGLSTLKRNFGPMLQMRDTASDRLQLALFAAAARKAIEGDMGALRQVRQMVSDNEQRVAATRVACAQESDDQAKIGKKEAARREAEKVAGQTDGGWGDLLRPGGEIH